MSTVATASPSGSQRVPASVTGPDRASSGRAEGTGRRYPSRPSATLSSRLVDGPAGRGQMVGVSMCRPKTVPSVCMISPSVA